jgi:hypothetical protein
VRVVRGVVRDRTIAGGERRSDEGGEALLVYDGLGGSSDVLLVLKVDFRPGDALSGGRGGLEEGHL